MTYDILSIFFVLKIFWQSFFTCSINLLKFRKFPNLNDTGRSVELWDSMNSIFKIEEGLTCFDKFILLSHRTGFLLDF